jgi:phage terminase small subunit
MSEKEKNQELAKQPLPIMTDKQTLFAEKWLTYRNATRAYIEAGYNTKTQNSAGVEGFKMLRKPNVAAYIAIRRAQIAIHNQLNLDDCLGVLADIINSNPMDYITLNEEGEAEVDMKKMTREKARAVKSVVTETSYIGEVKKVQTKLVFYDRDKAAVDYGKHLGGFTSKVELSGSLDIAEKMRAARNRAKPSSEQDGK